MNKAPYQSTRCLRPIAASLSLTAAGFAAQSAWARQGPIPNPHTQVRGERGQTLVQPHTRTSNTSCETYSIRFLNEPGDGGYAFEVIAEVEDLDGDGVIRADAGFYGAYSGPTEVRSLEVLFYQDGLSVASYQCVDDSLILYPFLYFEWGIGDLDLAAWDLGADPGVFTVGGQPVTPFPGAHFWDQLGGVAGEYGLPAEELQVSDLITNDTRGVLARWGSPVFDIDGAIAAAAVDPFTLTLEAKYALFDLADPTNPVQLCTGSQLDIAQSPARIVGLDLYNGASDLLAHYVPDPLLSFIYDPNIRYFSIPGQVCEDDVSNSGSLGTIDPFRDLAGSGAIAYAIRDTGSLTVADFTGGVIAGAAHFGLGGAARSIRVFGSTLLVDPNGRMRLVDVTDPFAPALQPSFGDQVDFFDVTPSGEWIYAVRDFDPGDGSVSGRDEIVVYQLTTPLTPIFIETFELPTEALHISATDADLVVPLDDGTVMRLDISNQPCPVEIARFDPGEMVTKGVMLDSKHVALAGESEALNFRVRAETQVYQTANEWDLTAATAEHFYVVEDSDLVSAISLADDSVQQFTLPGNTDSIAATQNVMAAQYTGGIALYVNDPGLGIVQSDVLARSADVIHLASNGSSMVFVEFSNDSMNLVTLDLSDPFSVGVAGQTLDVGMVLDVAYWDDRAYLSLEGGMITAFDLSDPSAPVLVGSVPSPVELRDIEAAGGWLAGIEEDEALPDEPGRVYIFDTQSSGTPVFAIAQELPRSVGSLSRVQTPSSPLLIAGSISGWDAIQLFSPCEPTIIANFDGSLADEESPIRSIAFADDRVIMAAGVLGFGIADASGLQQCDQDSDGNGLCDRFEPVQNLVAGTGFGTIQGALLAALPGDVVEVAPGLYEEGIELPPMPLTLRSTAGPESTIIDAELSTVDVRVLGGATRDTILEGFTIGGEHGEVRIEGASPTIRNCVIETGPEVTGTMVQIADGNAALFDRVQFLGHQQLASDRVGGVKTEGSTEFVNCLFAGNAQLEGALWVLDSGTVVRLTNCTFTDNIGFNPSYGGAVTLFPTTQAIVRNCIVTGNSPVDVLVGPGATADLEYNLFSTPMGSTNIHGDPGFVDPGSGDYRIAAGSIAIDAGDSSELPPEFVLDLAGLPRVLDDVGTVDSGPGVAPVVDMGAYEFQGTSQRCAADVDQNRVLNFDDIDLFVIAFLAGDLLADLDENGSLNFDDIDLFVQSFLDGCP